MNSFFGKSIGMVKDEINEILKINSLRRKISRQLLVINRINKIKKIEEKIYEVDKIRRKLYIKYITDNFNKKSNIIRLLLEIEFILYEETKNNPKMVIDDSRLFNYIIDIFNIFEETDIKIEYNLGNINFIIDDIVIYMKFFNLRIKYHDINWGFPKIKQIKNKVCYLGEDNIEKLVTLAKKYLEWEVQQI